MYNKNAGFPDGWGPSWSRLDRWLESSDHQYGDPLSDERLVLTPVGVLKGESQGFGGAFWNDLKAGVLPAEFECSKA